MVPSVGSIIVHTLYIEPILKLVALSLLGYIGFHHRNVLVTNLSFVLCKKTFGEMFCLERLVEKIKRVKYSGPTLRRCCVRSCPNVSSGRSSDCEAYIC